MIHFAFTFFDTLWANLLGTIEDLTVCVNFWDRKGKFLGPFIGGNMICPIKFPLPGFQRIPSEFSESENDNVTELLFLENFCQLDWNGIGFICLLSRTVKILKYSTPFESVQVQVDIVVKFSDPGDYCGKAEKPPLHWCSVKGRALLWRDMLSILPARHLFCFCLFIFLKLPLSLFRLICVTLCAPITPSFQMPMPVFSPFRDVTFPAGTDVTVAVSVTTVDAIETAVDTWAKTTTNARVSKYIDLAFHIEGLLDRVTRKVVN